MTAAPRRGESGEALVLALLVLLVVSVAAALVAADAQLQLRAMQEQAARTRLRAMTDAGVAEGLARLAAQPGWAGGEIAIDGSPVVIAVEALDDDRVELRVAAERRGFGAAVALEVDVPPSTPPRVLAYRPVSPSGG